MKVSYPPIPERLDGVDGREIRGHRASHGVGRPGYINCDARSPVPVITAQVVGIDYRLAVRLQLRDKAFAAIHDRSLVVAQGRGEITRERGADHVDVAHGIHGDIGRVVIRATAQVSRVD
jgi:hypothetical protein